MFDDPKDMGGETPQPSENATTSTSGTPPVSAGATAPAGSPPVPGGAAATAQPAAPQTPPDHSGNFGGKVLHAVLDALGGTDEVQYNRDPKTGAMVASHAKIGPGQQWKRVIAGSVIGAAAAAGVKPGPGVVGRGVAAGVGAGMEHEQNADQKKYDRANEDFDMQQKATVQKAQVAKLNQDVSTSAFELGRRKVQGQFDDAARENELVKSIQAGGQGSVDLGAAKTFDDVLAMHKDMPNLAEQQAHGNIIGIPHISEQGQIDGMHYALVTPEWKNAKLAGDQIYFRLQPPTKPGQKPTVERETVKAGAMSNGDFWTARMAGEQEILKWYTEQSKEGAETERARITAGATTGAAAIHAGATVKAAEIGAQSREVVAGTKANRQDVRDHDKAYVQPAEVVEKSYDMMSHAYDEYEAARKSGKELPSGAQSMVALSTHLATTFGNVKGARVTKDLIHEHLGARSISDSAKVAIQRLTNGDQLSPDQWDAFHDLISESRRLSWETAAREAKRKQVPIDFLPQDLQSLGQQSGPAAAAQPAQGGGGFFEKFGGKPLGGK